MRKGEEDPSEDQECICTPKEKKKQLPKCPEKLATCPWDPRFQNTNQSKYCYYSFVDWHRCIRLLGDDYEGCHLFEVCWRALCPDSWKEKWNEQLDKGTFPRPIYPPKDPQCKNKRATPIDDDV